MTNLNVCMREKFVQQEHRKTLYNGFQVCYPIQTGACIWHISFWMTFQCSHQPFKCLSLTQGQVWIGQRTWKPVYCDFLVRCQKILLMLSAVSRLYGNLSYLKVLIINRLIHQWIRFTTGTDYNFLVRCQKNWMAHMCTRAVTYDLIDHILEGFLCQLQNFIHYIFDGEPFGWQCVPLGSLNSHTALSMREMFWQRTGKSWYWEWWWKLLKC